MSFLVKFESSVLCILVALISHSGYFIQHLMNEKADFGLKILKKGTSKTEKNEKMPQNSQLLACLGVFEQLNLVRLNFAIAVKLYFVHLLLIKRVGMLKSREIA